MMGVMGAFVFAYPDDQFHYPRNRFFRTLNRRTHVNSTTWSLCRFLNDGRYTGNTMSAFCGWWITCPRM